MPSAPNTTNVLNAIQTLCQSLQVAGAAAFGPNSIQVGLYKDITDITPCLEISADTDDTNRFTGGNGMVQGGKIDDAQEYLLEVTAGLADGHGVELTLAGIRDSLTAAFHASALLGLQGQVAYSGIVPGSGKRGYKFRNGQFYRVYTLKLRVRYEYTVIIVP